MAEDVDCKATLQRALLLDGLISSARASRGEA